MFGGLLPQRTARRLLCALRLAASGGVPRASRRAERGSRSASGGVERGAQRSACAGGFLLVNIYSVVYMCNNGGTQPCARGAAAHTRHSANSRNAAHAERGPACMCMQRAPSRARLCVAPPGSACSRRLCPAVRWSDRAHAAARGNPDESVAADASGASHGARRAHARERCGACWSSAQRAPEPAYARVT